MELYIYQTQIEEEMFVKHYAP